MAKRRRQRIGKKGPRAAGKVKESKPLTAKGMASIAASTDGSAIASASDESSGPIGRFFDPSASGSKNRSVRRSGRSDSKEGKLVLSAKDKRYIFCFLAISLALTAFYWYIGGRNLFVFPAIFLLSVGSSRFWSGPVRRFAEKSGKS